ncbi:MAG: hypothetical protein EOP83_23905 [Verrucomicrobiaceae bacterium]|nr:MAG: hypothetical protein EOP83_23905 [Verrucomicrobiaceae bacterium]
MTRVRWSDQGEWVKTNSGVMGFLKPQGSHTPIPKVGELLGFISDPVGRPCVVVVEDGQTKPRIINFDTVELER